MCLVQCGSASNFARTSGPAVKRLARCLVGIDSESCCEDGQLLDGQGGETDGLDAEHSRELGAWTCELPSTLRSGARHSTPRSGPP